MTMAHALPPPSGAADRDGKRAAKLTPTLVAGWNDAQATAARHELTMNTMIHHLKKVHKKPGRFPWRPGRGLVGSPLMQDRDRKEAARPARARTSVGDLRVSFFVDRCELPLAGSQGRTYRRRQLNN